MDSTQVRDTDQPLTYHDPRPVAPDVQAAWEAAGSPTWARGVLPLLADADAFTTTMQGPSTALLRWRKRADRLGLSPTPQAA